MEYAISYLSRYPKTEQEIRIILYRKGYDTEDITSTMASLKKNDFINDEKYVESYFYSEVEKNGRPVYVAKQKLLQRGVPKHLIDAYLMEHEAEISEGIYEGIEKQIASYKKKGVEGFDIIQKLMKKGYRLQDIKKVLEKRD